VYLDWCASLLWMYVCVCMCVYVCRYVYVCVCMCACMYVYVCVYMYVGMCFFKHAPLHWSNITCCDFSRYWFSFVYRDAVTFLRLSTPFTIYNNTRQGKLCTFRVAPTFVLYVRFYDFVNVRNGCRCFFISSW